VEDGSRVVPQASKPVRRLAVVKAVAGLQTVRLRFVAETGAGVVATNLITIEVGIAGVSGLLIRSAWAESAFSPFGVTRQAQQAISSSAGSKV